MHVAFICKCKCIRLGIACPPICLLFTVNCYCKNNWVQYTDNLYSPRSRYGECIRAMDVDANWVTASFACQAMAPDAHLVNELTPHKNYFVYGKMLLFFTSYRSQHISHFDWSSWIHGQKLFQRKSFVIPMNRICR